MRALFLTELSDGTQQLFQEQVTILLPAGKAGQRILKMEAGLTCVVVDLPVFILCL